MARTFSGTAQYLSKSSALVSIAPCTLSVWFNSSAIATTQRLMGVGSPSGSCAMILQLSSSKLIFQVASLSGGFNTASHTLTLSSNTWYLATGVFNPNTALAVFVNGAGKVSVSFGAKIPLSLSQTFIGTSSYNNDFASNQFIGQLAQEVIYSAGLSDADVLSLAQGGSPNLVQPSQRVSYARLTGGQSPEPDFVLPTGWTLNGSPTQSANPRIFCP